MDPTSRLVRASWSKSVPPITTAGCVRGATDTTPGNYATSSSRVRTCTGSGVTTSRYVLFSHFQTIASILIHASIPQETKIKGYLNIVGFKVLADENVDPGRYGFRLVHDTEKPHFFSSDEQLVVREWMKALMKATITRDYTSTSPFIQF